MNEDITNFIESFTDFGTDVKDCFCYGNCYWFAAILYLRFGGYIVYDIFANHFGCEINNIVWDITGDVTNKYNWEDWTYLQKYYDPLEIMRINRDCIFK